MLNGEEWTSERRVMLLAILSLLLIPLIFAGMAIHEYIAFGIVGIFGTIQLICLFSYHGDAKKTKERAGQKPRWLLYTVVAMFFSNFVAAPIYLLRWHGQ